MNFDIDHTSPLISIIMPAYNAEKYIELSIDSVLNQTWSFWELLIINDGSTDATKAKISQFPDPRIKYFEQDNRGVSTARNVGLRLMQGEFFCFLDADDLLPAKSLESRINVFKEKPEVQFVDGAVEERTEDLKCMIRRYLPSFRGNPFKELIRIKPSCFLGQTWMVQRNKQQVYSMPTDQSHGEDLFFFTELARKGGLYDYTRETILIYRRREMSAMSDLNGLDDSYVRILRKLKEWPEVSWYDRYFFWLRSRRIMFLSYLFNKKSLYKAFFSLFKI
jgi:teichuronic acid biosynthesis glycosyltransferase TuaG